MNVQDDSARIVLGDAVTFEHHGREWRGVVNENSAAARSWRAQMRPDSACCTRRSLSWPWFRVRSSQRPLRALEATIARGRGKPDNRAYHASTRHDHE